MIEVAIQAAKKAGQIITDAMQHFETIKVSEKARNDLVTNVDQACERVIIEIIQQHYPEHGILAEESGHKKGNDYLWIIDPLDGTVNFIHGLPHFAVSIAIHYQDKLQHAVVYDPVHQELFTATNGKGARLNDQPISVSKRQQLQGSVLGTGFPFKQLKHLKEYTRMFETLLPYAAGIRRYGAAALDLAYIACGRLDGFWEFGIYPWDMGAGILLIKEAGGVITNFVGQEKYLTQEHIVAGNPKIHQAMLEIIQNCLKGK
jgi:myo-inositol-1(or 4)-monophosphatase